MATLLDMTRAHVPVLAGELIELTAPAAGETVVDCTFGAGGHAELMAGRIGPAGTLVCIDRDPAAEERFDRLAAELDCDTRFIAANFADALESLIGEGLRADVVYMDLGVSSAQIDTWERGFSYAYDAPLDMRMDTTQELDARAIVNGWEERRLAQVFFTYGEERYSRQIARSIVREREREPITTTNALVEIIKGATPTPSHFAGGHPARRVFQALRIAVNGELDALERALPSAWSLLRADGRLAAISFHSLEDRRVKRFFAERARGCICPPDLPICVCGHDPEADPITRRAVVPTSGEIAQNARARSGRLRVARKLGEVSG